MSLHDPVAPNVSKAGMNPRMAFLYSLYKPHQDPTNLPLKTLEQDNFMNELRDNSNVRPKVEPSYSCIERSAVEAWRQQVEQQVKTRISGYRCTVANTQETPRCVKLGVRDYVRTEHRMLQIPELLDVILQFAGPAAQIRALRVSKPWHRSAMAVISSCNTAVPFRASPLCMPAEHGKLVDEDAMAPLPPTSEEMKRFELDVERIYDSWGKSKDRRAYYFPAKCAQRRDLPSHLSKILNHVDTSQPSEAFPWNHNVRISRETDIYWLDLSQFEVNPYLEALFAEEHQSKHLLGRWEICLRKAASSLETLLLNSSLSSKALLDAIGSMHVTHPPCRALGIYHHDFSRRTPCGSNALLTRVRNDHGIRVDEFMDALQNSLPAIRDTWLMNADQLVEEIQQAHWIDDIWTIPGVPTIRVYLDNVDMLDERNVINPVPSSDEFLAYYHARGRVLGLSSHITRAAQMDAEPFRRSREKAWISEDLIEPAESTTGRHPINWHR
ncbi:hypothetical protein J4E89_004329 [Alternaria sp. Ai002NY15]|nr:hypothetical protein J4E89_004329 [Alternaria sp. Ai002NY15]